MPRRREVPNRIIIPDSKYNSKLVSRFVSCIMRDGKKSTAEGIFYQAMDIIGQRTKEDPKEVFKRALNNVKPVIEVKSRRVGGSTYQVPIEVRSDRRISLAIRWVVDFTKKRRVKTMYEALAAELIDAANNKGSAIKKKEDTHKMADANKAFAHYKW